jgi:hypothetical protein
MPAETPESPLGELLSPRTLRMLTLAALAVGIAWRVIRYALRFPVWGDEAMLCLNVLHRSYAALAQELSYGQLAPILYLCAEKFAVGLLGTSELAIRLLPLLAGIGSLLLYARLARVTMAPLPATIAVGILAVAVWPVSMCTQAKPYAFDLFWALMLLVPTAEWLREPQRSRWLIVLTILVAPALFSSFPAVFIAGSISLTILAVLRQQPSRRCFAWFVAFNVVMLTAFLSNYFIIIDHHVGVSGQANTTGTRMQMYWREAFPPGSPGKLLTWLLLSHIGELFSCPVGADRGGSIITVLLFGAGVAALWKRREYPLLILLLTPFALNLIASVGRFYPYAVPRLSQHLIPSVALLSAAGAASALQAIPTLRTQQRLVFAGFALLGVLGLVGVVRDVARPGRDAGVLWMRHETQALLHDVGQEPLVVLHDDELDSVLKWYLGIRPGGFLWGQAVDWNRLDPAIREVWTFRYKFNDQVPVLGAPPTESPWTAQESHRVMRSHDITRQFPYTIFPVHDDPYEQALEWTLWKRPLATD